MPAASLATSPAGGTAPDRSARTRAFDFRRPNKLNRDHVRNLQIVHETFAGQFATMLSSSLRSKCGVRVESIEELSYDEYVRDIPIPTHMSILSLDPLPGAGVFHLEVDGAMTVVELLLGGQGTATVQPRPLSDIESSLIRMITDRALRELAYAFESVTQIEPAVVGIESNPQFAQLASPTDMVVVVSFSLRINELTEARMSLCYTYAAIEPLLARMVGHADPRAVDADVARAASERLAERITGVDVDVAVVFDPVPMRSHEILALRPGDVLALRHPAEALLTATVDGVPLFAVKPARTGRRVAAQIFSSLR